MQQEWKQVDDAVMARFREIRAGLRERTGNYIYSGGRCQNLGWRFRQRFRLRSEVEPVATEIESGLWDSEIEATWHGAASAEHWYRYEKDYGRDDPEPECDPDVINGTHYRIGGVKCAKR